MRSVDRLSPTSSEAGRAALETDREMLEVWFRHSREAVALVRDQVVVRANPALARLLDLSRQDLIGRSVETVFAPRSPEDFRASLEATRPVPDPYECEITTPAAGTKWIELRVLPLTAPSSHLIVCHEKNTVQGLEEALRTSEFNFRLLFEHVSDGVSVYERFPGSLDRRLIDCNQAYARMAGRTKAELLTLGDPRGIQIYDHTNEDSWEIQRKIEAGVPYQGVVSWLRPDGQENIVEYRAMSIRVGGRLLVYSIDRDVTEQKRLEQSLRRALEEKETLLSEIHHRVKNNLQVAISILSLQSRYIPDESLKSILCDNQNRFRAMGLVHETLYNSSSLSHINLKEYIQRLTAGLYEAYAARTADISLSLDVDPMEVNIDQAMPCGLVLNELVANSLKHAFPGGGPGRIWIAARDRGDGWVEMTVADDGIGLPPDINLQHHGTLGLRLTVRTVENQLRGVLSVERGAGAVFHIKFHRRTDHRI